VENLENSGMRKSIGTALAMVGSLMLIAASCSMHAQQQDITAFEEHIIEMTFAEAGVMQTANTFPLAKRMEAYQSPGVCVTVVDGNTVCWTRGYGVLRADREDAVTEESIFQAGSVSKFVTALLVLHYVDQGVLDLDCDINSYLTSWMMPVDDFGVPITLRLLLTHQAGLPGTNFGRASSSYWPTLPQILSGQYPATNLPAVSTIVPGTAWLYSNIGYVVIQLLLEDVLQMSLNDIAEQVLFGPLGMHSTTFNYPLPPERQQHEAWPHENGIALPAIQDSPARAQGGLMTTTQDMALLVIEVMKAYKGVSDTVLSQGSAQAMMAKEVSIPLDAYGTPFDMGLGVLLDDSGSSLSFLHPGQSYPGSAFFMVAFPETQQAVVMGITGDRGDQLELEILATLAELYQWPSGQYFR
jgi:CubicO group peptidase (beta-lactamase class C family)